MRSHITKNLKERHEELPIRKIHQLLLQIRSQAKRCGNCLSTSQLFSILITMYATGGSIFVFVNEVAGGRKFGSETGEIITLGISSLWPIFGMSRLYVKIWMGVTITKEASICGQ